MVLGENSLVPHLRADGGGALRPEAEQEFQLTTIGDYCQRAGIQTIDLLKTDTEGHHVAVLTVAQALLASGAVRFVMSEVGGSSANSGNAHLGDVHDFLTARDFIFYGLYDPRDMTLQPHLRWSDSLFVHNTQLNTPFWK